MEWNEGEEGQGKVVGVEKNGSNLCTFKSHLDSYWMIDGMGENNQDQLHYRNPEMRFQTTHRVLEYVCV